MLVKSLKSNVDKFVEFKLFKELTDESIDEHELTVTKTLLPQPNKFVLLACRRILAQFIGNSLVESLLLSSKLQESLLVPNNAALEKAAVEMLDVVLIKIESNFVEFHFVINEYKKYRQRIKHDSD